MEGKLLLLWSSALQGDGDKQPAEAFLSRPVSIPSLSSSSASTSDQNSVRWLFINCQPRILPIDGHRETCSTLTGAFCFLETLLEVYDWVAFSTFTVLDINVLLTMLTQQLSNWHIWSFVQRAAAQSRSTSKQEVGFSSRSLFPNIVYHFCKAQLAAVWRWLKWHPLFQLRRTAGVFCKSKITQGAVHPPSEKSCFSSTPFNLTNFWLRIIFDPSISFTVQLSVRGCPTLIGWETGNRCDSLDDYLTAQWKNSFKLYTPSLFLAIDCI